MTKREIKKWQSSYNLLIVIVIGWILVTFLGDYKSLLLDKDYLLLLGVIFSLFTISTLGTYVKVNGHTLIDVGRRYPFQRHEVSIDQITKVARVQAFAFENWGSYFAIYIADGNNNKVFALDIRENNYSAKSIKELLRYLLKVKPSIEIDPQYQDLIDGKIEDELWFSRKPATHKSYDTVL